MKEILSVTADVQHGRVTFRFSDDTEECVSLKSLTATAKVRVKRADVEKAARARAARARAEAAKIDDQKIRELHMLELTSEEYKGRWRREAHNEIEAGLLQEAGAKRHTKYMADARAACNALYASASR